MKMKYKEIELSNLEPARGTLTEQRQFLKSIVAKYRVLKLRCLNEDVRTGLFSELPALNKRVTFFKLANLRDSLKGHYDFKVPTSEACIGSDFNPEFENTTSMFLSSNKNIYY
jgi:hypothetical protein